jgi:hypothetical protein
MLESFNKQMEIELFNKYNSLITSKDLDYTLYIDYNGLSREEYNVYYNEIYYNIIQLFKII